MFITEILNIWRICPGLSCLSRFSLRPRSRNHLYLTSRYLRSLLITFVVSLYERVKKTRIMKWMPIGEPAKMNFCDVSLIFRRTISSVLFGARRFYKTTLGSLETRSLSSRFHLPFPSPQFSRRFFFFFFSFFHLPALFYLNSFYREAPFSDSGGPFIYLLYVLSVVILIL